MARPTTNRKDNPQKEVCGFYHSDTRRCGITCGGELICNKKRCTLFKNRVQLRKEQKIYGWPYKEPIGGKR